MNSCKKETNYLFNEINKVPPHAFNFEGLILSRGEKFTLEYLFRHFIYTGTALTTYKEVSKQHLELGVATTIEIITGKKRGKFDYIKSINGLIAKKIIERTSDYSIKNKKAKSIRFTSQFLSYANALEIINSAKKYQRIRTSNKLRSYTDTAIRKLNIRAGVNPELVVDTHITPNYVRKLIETDVLQIEEGAYLTIKDGLKRKTRLTLVQAIEIAKKEQEQVIYHKKERTLIIEKETLYIEKKVQELRLIYKSMFLMIKNKNYFPTTISKTNNRLTSFFTVFPSSLLKYLELQKENFTTFDISNSQFCFLANIIMAYDHFRKTGKKMPLYCKIEKEKKYFEVFENSFGLLLDCSGELSKSVQDFIGAACHGNLYEQVMEKTNLTRNEAKKGMFLVAFSSHHCNSELKKKIKISFPQIINFIDKFKKQEPNEDKRGFAVWLQRIESSVCVPEILKTLQNKYLVLTRHDSFTIKSKEADIFKKDLKEKLDKYLAFGYNLKEEKYSI